MSQPHILHTRARLTEIANTPFKKIALACIGLLYSGTLSADSTRLSLSEVQLSQKLAQLQTSSDNGVSTRTMSIKSNHSSSASNNAAAERHTLRIERHKDKYSDVRLADVYTYDYQQEQTYYYQVDLATKTIRAQRRYKGHQLPLTSTEVEQVKSIITQNPKTIAVIADEFLRVTGKPFNSLSDLQTKVMVFSAQTSPTQTNQLSSQCGQIRCAQVMLYSKDHVTVEVSPVVHLASGSIIDYLNN